MKLTTIIGTTIAAVGLAACGATVTPTSRPATPSPTVAPTPTPTATPAPTAMPTPTATPPPAAPVLVLRETCDGSANAGSAASVSFTGDIPGYDFVVYGPGFNGGWDGAITADAHGDGTTGDLTAGSYEFTNSSGGSPGTPGSFTISTCAPSVRVTACDHAGTASGGAIAWTEPGYSTLTITGPAPSTAHFTLAASAGQYGPLTAGAYSYTFNVFKTSGGGTFTIPACTGIATG